jgi:hypothetical protein
MSKESSHARNRCRFHWLAAIIVITWYGVVYLAAHPLSSAPVVDSWIYEHAVTHFNQTGRFQFSGFTQALPIAQVLYGVAWSRLFGQTSPSMDISTAVFGIVGGLLFYLLTRKCGAAVWTAAAAAALLICNPCYLFLSFSFMTEVPFLAMLLASYVAFACAGNCWQGRWLWLAAACASVAFAVRPFAAATIAGEAAVLLIFRYGRGEAKSWAGMAAIVPFLAALITCAGIWIWLMILNPKPWMLQYDEYRLKTYFTAVPLRSYFADGLLGPAIYLGVVSSPLAVLHAIHCWRRSVVIGAAILISATAVLHFGREPVWNLEKAACFGGSYGALVLSGAPQHDVSAKLGWILLVLGTAGFAGVCNAWWRTIHDGNPAVLAVLLAGAIYWIAIPLLWFFADRYDLVLVPAACLPLALAPLPRRTIAVPVAGLMIAALALVSLGGIISYHRTMHEIILETGVLLRQGIPRREIDAGYALNGRDLYVYPAQGIDTFRDEPPIPLITTSSTLPYVFATSAVGDAVIWRKFSGCGPLGFSGRPLFVLKTTTPSSP